MNPVLVIGIFFAAIFLVVAIAVGVGMLVMERRNGDAVEETGGLTLLKQETVSSITAWAKLLARFDFVEVLQRQLQQADLNWSAGRVTAMMLLSGTLAAALLMDRAWLPVIGFLGLTGGATLLPYFFVLRTRSKRLRRFEEQFPDALDSLCRPLRAGQPFAAAMEALASESSQPIAGEIRRTIEEWKLGSSWDLALGNLAGRIPLTDVGVFVAAVRLQMRSGGRLGEVLNKLAEGMRESASMQGEVRSLAAHGRMTGAALTVMPVAIAGLMFMVNPNQMMLLVEHPSGRNLVFLAIGMLIAAHFIIRKLVDVRM